MPVLQNSSPIICTSAALPSVDADLLIVPWFEGEDPSSPGSIAGLPPVPGINDAVGGEIGRALASREFAARAYDTFITSIVDRAWKARRLALVGAGPVATFDTSMARRLATAAGLAARQRRVERIAFVLRPGRAEVSGDIDVAGFLQAVNEGLTLAEFDNGAYKTDEPSARGAQLTSCTIVLPDMPDSSPESKVRLDGAARRGRLLGECSNLARGLANEPGNALTPREFAARASDIVGGSGASVEILDEKQIEALGMGMLLGVARGSTEPPRLMVFRHEPAHTTRGPVLGLVGKGVTFDTGGISIKPAENMDRMKDDMAGGAAVICAMRAIALLGAPIRVIGVVPATENMPGGRAIKPGDILKSAEGKTVEVLNTDAEGRLILGDGLWYARKLGATHLVDVATLTAAVVIALGKLTSGIFGTPDSWVKQIRKVAERAGDRVWQLPLVEEYREQLKSEIADFSNVGGRPASSITAALFLKEFTGGLPWAHLDIAGTAWAEDAKPYQPKGPTGVAVRTLAELAFTIDQS
jgi:leucyl aminopeptidase